MIWLYIGILTFIGFAAIAMMIREGLWNNAITIVIHVFSGLLALAFYGLVATWLDESVTDGSYTYWIDFLSLWAVYVISFVVLRLVTNQLSKTRVRFKMPVEWSGSIVSAVLGAYLLVGFVGVTLHTAPLADDFLGGAIAADNSDDLNMKLTRPDIAWLRLYGAMITRVMPSAAGKALSEVGVGGIDKALKQAGNPYSEFVPHEMSVGEMWTRMFIVQYQNRRRDFAAAPGLRVSGS
jgi:hypothetical protein